ncbi:MAG TPA: hypothetical protein DFS52_31850, partial [Myxococcales bacterium]|nr:hypothetical protein [Myxococcales bacterium]
MLSGLGACVHTVDRRPVVYETPPPEPQQIIVQTSPTYRYWGAHLIPDAWGGGWCLIEGVHDHDYAPVYPEHYRYESGVYYYSAPVVVTYWDVHPDPYGGWCYLHGSHTHNYHPPRHHHAHFQWDRNTHRYT